MPLDPSAFGTKKQPTAAPAAPMPAGQRPGFQPTEAPTAPGPGLLGAGPFGSPEEVTETAAGGLPRPIAAVIRAFQSTVGEDALTITPRQVSGVTGSSEHALPSPIAEGAAVLSILSNVTPVGRVANRAAMSAQATLETLSGNPNMAKTVVALTQAGEAFVSGLRAVRELPQRAKAIFGEAKPLKEVPVAPPGHAAHLPQERMARGLQLRTRLGLNRAKFRAQQDLDAAEAPFMMMGIAPTSPGYVGVSRALTQLEQDGARLTGEAGETMRRIDEAIQTGNPIRGSDVVDLRRLTRDRSKYGVNSLDPNRPIAPGRINEFRDELANGLELAAPAPQAHAFRVARNNYRLNYAAPARALESLTNLDTEPRVAFDKIFNPTNRDLFVNMTRHIANSPGLRGKLRMGFIDKMTGPDGELLENASDVFKTWRGALASSGVFSREELHALDRFTQAKEIPTLRDTLSLLVPAGKRRGQILPAVIGIGGVSTFGTGKMLGLIAAAGGLLSLRRLRLLGANNPQSRLAVSILGGRIDDFAKALNDESDAGPPADVDAE